MPNPILIGVVRLAVGRAVSPMEKTQYNMALLWQNHSLGSSDRGTKEITGSYLALWVSYPAYISVSLYVTLQAAAFNALAIPDQELTTVLGPTLLDCLPANLGDPKVTMPALLLLFGRSRVSKQSLICRQTTSTTSKSAVSQHHPAKEENSPCAEDADTK